MDQHVPTEPELVTLRLRLGAEAFERRAQAAEQKLERVKAVVALMESGTKTQAALRKAAAGLSATTFRRHLAHLQTRPGEEWERLVDRRVPPKSWEVPESWRGLVIGCRQMRPDVAVSEIRAALVAQYGPQAALSDSQLRTILREAGLSRRARGPGAAEPKVEELTGGAGLALLLAAGAESGAVAGLARVIGREVAALEPNPAAAPEPPGRDENGRFTAEYNQRRLAGVGPDEPDPRFRSVTELRPDKDLSRLGLSKMNAAQRQGRLWVAAVAPLLTERRGLVGLDGPTGAWTRVVSPVAYRWRTMDKFLAELKYAGVREALWDQHLRQWETWNARWTAGQGFRQYVAYLDGNQEAWWTADFARSGKVARLGRVMPCLSRVLLCGGAGTPLLVQTYSGQASLRKQLPSVLARIDEIRGDGEFGRLLVVDAELVSVELFEALSAEKDEREHPRRQFITVLKGAVLKNLEFEPDGGPIPFRARDQLRDGRVLLNHPKNGPASYPLRVVEMVRCGSRHPHPTYFATNAPAELLPPTTVAEAYLERWPHNEQLFRRGREGGGLQHTHGYGRRALEHVALLTERQKVAAQLQRARKKESEAEEQAAALDGELERERARVTEMETRYRDAVYVKAAVRKLERQRDHVAALEAAEQAARHRARDAKRLRERREAESERLASMPETIVERDVELDSIATCLKLTLLSLFEFVLREYFAGVRMELRTFNEEFVRLPARLERTADTLRFSIAANPRSPKRMDQLAAACAEVTRRGIRHGGRRLILELRLSDAGG